MHALRFLIAIALAPAFASASAPVGMAEETPPTGVELAIGTFEFLGCSGDWRPGDWRPEIWKTHARGSTTFIVRHPSSCGASSGIHPRARLSDGVLDLDYEEQFSDGVAAVCMCEYWARYSFHAPPDGVQSATFRQRDSLLSGDWPKSSP